MGTHQSTKDRLLMAAIDLMALKGYDATTTKEIAAAAGVNEITLFRHFGSKQKLLEHAYQRYHYADEMTKLFEESLTGDLYADLLMISRTYHKIMNRNKKLISIAMKGSGSLPDEVHKEAQRHPLRLKDLLTAYLKDMVAKNKARTPHPEMAALSFMWMNYGAFVSGLNAAQGHSEEQMQTFIEESVRLFARALAP